MRRCASQARACVLCAKLLQCCCPRTWPARDPGRMQTLSSHFTLYQNWEKSADKSLSQPWCSHSNTIYDLQLQKTIVLRMRPLHQATLTQPTTMRSAETELQNTIELRAMASEIAAPNRISTPKRQKDDFEALFKRNFKRKIISAKIEKICWQFTFAALMLPFQYDLRSSAAKDNSITHAAAAPSNLDAATTMRFAASRSKPAPIYGRGNIKWRQWSSHSNAICN